MHLPEDHQKTGERAGQFRKPEFSVIESDISAIADRVIVGSAFQPSPVLRIRSSPSDDAQNQD